MSSNLSAVVQKLVQNLTNLPVLEELMTPDATWMSLTFDDPELKKIMPWVGVNVGPKELPKIFAAIQRYWKTLDFQITDAIEQGSRVGLFGSFTYKAIATGKQVTSPFSLLARFEGEKIASVQFLEDSFGTAYSFKTGGKSLFYGEEVQVSLRVSPKFLKPHRSQPSVVGGLK